MMAELPREDVAHGVEIRAAMMGDDALGVAGRARGVGEGDRIPLVIGHSGLKRGIALRKRRLVFDFADPLSAGESRIVHVDHERLRPLHLGHGLRDQG